MGGDSGAGARENRGREGYGRPERKGREVGVPKGLEAGEIGENYATLHDISQSKKGKTEEAKKKRGGSRDCKVREAGGLDPPVPPPHKAQESFVRSFIISFCTTWQETDTVKKRKNNTFFAALSSEDMMSKHRFVPDYRLEGTC